MKQSALLLAAGLTLAFAPACASSSSCTALAIERPMAYEATVPTSVDLASMTLSICFGADCISSRVAASANPNVAGLICQPTTESTPSFQTTCTWSEVNRQLSFRTNTVYGGHAGSDSLVVTAVGPAGTSTELLHGTVVYTDTSDDAARGACTTAWQGTFTPS